MNIIEFSSKYEFAFLEENDIKFKHPVSNYYLKLSDLSINLLVSLKWIKWGYNFLELLKKNLDDLDEDFYLKNIINKSIQTMEDMREEKKIIVIDDREVKNLDEFNEILNDFYLNKKYFKIFDDNSKVHLKLKLNLREYLIISNLLFPTLIKIS